MCMRSIRSGYNSTVYNILELQMADLSLETKKAITWDFVAKSVSLEFSGDLVGKFNLSHACHRLALEW